MGKDMKDYLPILNDQGVPNLTGAYAQAQTMQSFSTTMPADGIFTFVTDLGGSDMETAGVYQVIIQNHTDEDRQGICAIADRLVTQITISGPTTADVLDILIIGRIKGQTAAS